MSTTYPPPAKIISGSENDSLQSLGIQSSDILTLKQVAAAAAPAAAASVPPAVAAPPPAAVAPAQRPASPPRSKPRTLADLQHVQPLTLQPITNDNSCMFNTVGYLMEQRISTDLMRQLRETVAAVILSDSSDRYGEAMLGCPKEQYVQTMLKDATWGGGIELAILADTYDVEIAAIDVETAHQYLFGSSDSPSARKSRRIYCVYSGVHYDALYEEQPGGGRRTIFSPDDAVAESRALKAALLLQAQGAFTNVTKFQLRCSVCKTGLVGAVEAQQHAQQTGHQNFEEYK